MGEREDGVAALQVAKHAEAVWQQKRAALLPRVQFVGGSFLEAGARHDSASAASFGLILNSYPCPVQVRWCLLKLMWWCDMQAAFQRPTAEEMCM